MSIRISAWAVLAAALVAAPAMAQERIRVASSSTVFPFVSAVAEHFGRTGGLKAPVVESLGSGGGLKLFCGGAGKGTPDIAGASRRITGNELKTCAANHVTEISEIAIGYDGIVLARAKSGKPLDLTRRELFLALAKSVPVDGKLAPNPYRRWDEINPALPKEEIRLFGPAPNHGTRDVLAELVMEVGCETFPEIAALPAEARRKACLGMREDGRFVEVTADYTVVLQKLVADPQAAGILPFGTLDQNGDKIRAAALEGRQPSYEAIFAGTYALSRPLFVYVKKAHLATTAGLRDFLVELTSDRAQGPSGYLTEMGLVALPDAVRKAEAEKAAQLPSLAGIEP